MDDLREEIMNNFRRLLTEHSEGIQLVAIEEIYKKTFAKSLLAEILPLALPDLFDSFATIIRQDTENDSFYDIIVCPGLDHQFQLITDTGIVANTFNYNQTRVECDNGGTFLAFVSNIDKQYHCIYVQAENAIQEWKESTEVLDTYYSDPISDQLIVDNIEIGLACVTKFQEVYHRVYICENHVSSYVIIYVDIGLREKIQHDQSQFKYLLNYFADFPCLAIPCRLEGIDFKLNNYQIPSETCNQLVTLCQGGPFFVELYEQSNEIWNVKIYDSEQRCLNDIILEKGLAFRADMSSANFTTIQQDSEEAQKTLPFINDKKTSIHYIDDVSTPQRTAPSQHTPFGDYVEDTNATLQPELQAPSSSPGLYDDYEIDEQLSTSNTRQQTRPKSTRHNDRLGLKSNENKNQCTRNTGQSNEMLKRRFASVKKVLLQNRTADQRRQSNSKSSPMPEKRDEFAEWMGSWWNGRSLWDDRNYCNSIHAYLGRIYGHRTEISRLYIQLRKANDEFDEVDLLYKLIARIKDLPRAQKSLDKWQDNSRIDRRLEDIKFIFEYDKVRASFKGQLTLVLAHSEPTIDRQTIKDYFDLGCGDGSITAGIGDYLGLSKQHIFGGDVYDGENKHITFVPMTENQSIIRVPDNHIDLVTCFVTLHHVPDLKKTLSELARIVRSDGYLILREHDCEHKLSLTAKYLNFVHAIMMIAGVGEFANSSPTNYSKSHQGNNEYYDDTIDTWKVQKSHILEYTKSIQYHDKDEWQQELECVGFHHCATYSYGINGSGNPQKLFYAVYQFGAQ